MTINILHSIDTKESGGAEKVFLQLACHLDSNRFNHFIIAPGGGWVENQLRKHHLSPIPVNPHGSFNFGYLKQIIHTIRQNKIDIIQSHLFGSNVYCSIAGILTRTPVISTFHGAVDFDRSSERLVKAKFFCINHGSAKLVFVSDDLIKQAEKRSPLKQAKIHKIFNGIDLEIYKPQKNIYIRQELGLDEEDILVGTVGNVRSPKGYQFLLQAAAQLKNTTPNFKFVIAGDTNDNIYSELLSLRAQLNLEKQVFFLGFRDDVSRFLNGLDIFLLSSISEGFSLATIESMACGIPVIATRSGGPEEIITHGIDGILIDINSPEQIADTLLQFKNDPSLQKRLIDKAMQMVRSRFSLESMIMSYESLYQSVLDVQSQKYL